MARLHRISRLSACLMAAALAGCEFLDDEFFGGGEDPPLPGVRISVLELAENLEPDPQVADLDVILPEPIANTDWPQAGQNATHRPGHLYIRVPFTEAWRTDIGTGSGGTERLINPPIVVGGRIFVKDASGRLTALEALTGDEIWQVRVASPVEDSTPLGGGVAYADGLLFVTTGFGEILALDPANGGLIWRTAANGPTRAAPSVADGRVFVVTVDNQLQALDAETGAVLWTHTGILETASLLGGASPAIGPNVLIAAYSSGEVFALRLETGRPSWSDSLTAIRRIGALASLADIRGMPVLDDDRVIAVSHADRMASIDLRSGERLWEQQIGGINTPWVAGNFIFMITVNNDVIALTREGGRIRWVTPLPRWRDPEERSGPVVWSGPVLAAGYLIVVGSEGDGLVLAADTGEIAAQFPVPAGSQVPPIVAGNTLYVLTDDADLIAYR